MNLHFKLLLLLAIGGALVMAQSSQPPKPGASKEQDTVRIATELVQIDLIVTDKQGQAVRELKREEFELYEDGKKQILTHFATGTSKQPALWLTLEKKTGASSSSTTESETTSALTNGRYIVLAVDDFHLSATNLVFVKRALTKFIREQMVAGDQIALVTTSGSVGLFQQFTSERAVLERAVNRLSVQERNLTDPNSIPNITEYQAELIEFGDRGALDLAVAELARREGASQSSVGGSGGEESGSTGQSGGRPAGRQRSGGASGQQAQSSASNQPSQRDAWEQRVRTQARMVLAMSANYTQATLNTLESVTRGLRRLTGRKMMVLLSDGFFLGGSGMFSRRLDLRRLTDAATRAGVMIYSIDARGLATINLGGDASDRVEADITQVNAQTRIQLTALNARRDGLYALAAETGGTMFYNSNDLNLGLQRVLDANEAYYVLAYEPPEMRRDGRFHKIEVRVPGRPDVNVRTRSGYFAPDEAAEKTSRQAEEKQQEKLKKLAPEKREQEVRATQEKLMATALGALWPLRELPLETTVDFMEMQGFSGAIFNTHINAANLTFEAQQGRQFCAVHWGGYVFDERGKVAASFSERINIEANPEVLQQMLQLGFNHRRLMELKPGLYQARVVVREEKTGRTGTAFRWLEVPNLGNQQLALSSLFLTEPGRNAWQELSNSAVTSQYQIYRPQPASAARRFKTGGEVDLLLFVYNARPTGNTVDLITQMQLYSGSKLIYASPPMKIMVAPDADLQRVPYAARVPLRGVPAGAYELRVVVTDRVAQTSARQQVNFTVE